MPGTLLVAGNQLHFVETHARVAPADYLGLRALKVWLQAPASRSGCQAGSRARLPALSQWR